LIYPNGQGLASFFCQRVKKIMAFRLSIRCLNGIFLRALQAATLPQDCSALRTAPVLRCRAPPRPPTPVTLVQRQRATHSKPIRPNGNKGFGGWGRRPFYKRVPPPQSIPRRHQRANHIPSPQSTSKRHANPEGAR
jgi:hypothetical protein